MKISPLTTRKEEERVFLVGLQTGEMKKPEAEASLEELQRLAESTTGMIVGSTLAHVRNPTPSTFFSEGIAENLGQLIQASNAKTVIVDEDLSPAQQKNLEDAWKVTLLNRSELILDIFARNAHTSEGKLQVELAQYHYRLPRLRGQGVKLSRLGGGIGTRGPGETMLETDRRIVEQRIHTLEEKVDRLKRQRKTQRARRTSSEIPIVALVGYTNAGKSTLLNALTGAKAFVEDRLFATLDPLTRRGMLPSGMSVAFIDTVGFINRLPTQLAAAFRATLEEVQYADALIHVVDVSSAHYEDEIKVTDEVLKELGVGSMPTLTVWNKIDLLDGSARSPQYLEHNRQPSAAISALDGSGMDRLHAKLQQLIDETRSRVWLKLGFDQFSDVHRLESEANVHETLHREDGIYLDVSLPPDLLRRYEAHRTTAPVELEADS